MLKNTKKHLILQVQTIKKHFLEKKVRFFLVMSKKSSNFARFLRSSGSTPSQVMRRKSI